MHFLGLIVAVAGVASAAESFFEEERTVCPLTAVNAYKYTCSTKGWVQKPSLLKKIQNVSSVESCASKCLANTKCLSFRYNDENSQCYLYKKYLNSMDYTTTNFQPGIYNERYCYTTNCNVIDSCQASIPCNQTYRRLDSSGEYYNNFEYFGCGYGVQFKGKKPAVKTTVFPGSMALCNVIHDCASVDYGTIFTVSYSIPTDKWLCLSYSQLDDSYAYYPAPYDEFVDDQSFRAKNSSIGASYAFRLYHYFFCYHSCYEYYDGQYYYYKD